MLLVWAGSLASPLIYSIEATAVFTNAKSIIITMFSAIEGKVTSNAAGVSINMPMNVDQNNCAGPV